MTSGQDEASEWIETAEPRTIAHWPCPFDGTSEHVGEVVKIGTQYITAHNGLTSESQLIPGCAILVYTSTGRVEFIRWEPTRISSEHRPANSGDPLETPGNEGCRDY